MPLELYSFDLPVHSKDLKHLPEKEFWATLDSLGKDKLEELKYTWPFWARPEQLEPEAFHLGKYDYWILNAGRGFGKTRTGAEWVRHRVKCGDKRIACVAPTKGDVRRVMVEGDSGLLNVCWKNDKTYRGAELGYPEWYPTNNTMVWANGAKVEFFSSEDPDRLRGPQFYAAWCDEVSSWNHQQEVWDMLSFTMRLGKHPKICVTTTPKPTKLMRDLIKYERSIVTSGSTYDNAGNLSPSYINKVKSLYEGTRLGRQELYAEILDEASGALWTRELLQSCEIEEKDLPDLDNFLRIVVSVDPATTDKVESDLTGIVVAGIDVNHNAYVLGDYTDRYSPGEWAKKVVELYHEFSADRIVAEKNQGGDMVKHTIETEDPTVPIRMVHASRGKMARAEPVAALYERDKVRHVKGLNDLEDQMVQWEPLGNLGSPDRLDALVWALTDLLLKGVLAPNLKLAYGSAVGNN